MSTFSFGGLATGLDTNAIVAQLVAIRRQPIVRLEEQKSFYQLQSTALTDLETKLEALQTAVKALDTPNEFGSLSASSSDTSLLTASATSLANPGTFDIVITSLARYQKDISQGYSSSSDNVGTGSITITVNGEDTQIDLTEPTNSLSDLRDAINDAGAGVYASLLNDGSDTTPYRLILTAADSGLDGAFTADLSGLSGGTTPVLTNQTAAADASLSIDGIDITASSNIINDAVTGMTFNLLDADAASTVTVTVDIDDVAITDKVQTLVDSYNDLFAFIDAQGEGGGTLRGDNTLRTVRDRIRNLFTVALDEETSSGDYRILAQVGITQGVDGQLEFDTTEFSTALGEDFASVRDLFVERGTNLGKAYLVRTSIDDMTDFVDGMFKISQDSLTDRMENIDDTIERYERSVDHYQVTLERKFTAMEGMVANLQAQGSYLYATLYSAANM